MSLKRVKDIIKFVEKLAQSINSVSSVDVITKSDKPNVIYQANFSQINLKENTSHNFCNIYQINQQNQSILQNDFPISVKPLNKSLSPNQTYQVILQQIADKSKPDKPKQVIEIYKKNSLIQSLNLDDYHEKIESGSIVGKAFAWSADETKFLYIANPKEEKGKYFLDLEFEDKKDLDEAMKFNEYKQDFGERMVGIYNPCLYQYDIVNKKLEQIIIPPNVFPCYPSYLDEKGTKLIFQGYKIPKEFKYGILHCFNRETSIYYLEELKTKQLFPKPKKDQQEKTEKSNEQAQQEEEKKLKEEEELKNIKFKVISEDQASFKPILSPDKKKIAYFGCSLQPAHLNYLGMKLIDVETFQITSVFPVKQEYEKEGFMGVCGFYDDIKNFFWLKDSKHFILTTIQSGASNIYLVNTNSKEIAQLNHSQLNSEVWQIIQYFQENHLLFATRENMQREQQLAVLNNFDISGDKSVKEIAQNVKWEFVQIQQNEEALVRKLRNLLSNVKEEIIQVGDVQGFVWRIDSYDDKDVPDELKELWGETQPIRRKPEERPLAVLVHGGPHGATLGYFLLSRLFYLLQGYVLLAPNYSGSAGYGQKFIDRLLGKIGELDAKEILAMIVQIQERKLCDPKKVFIQGGSYGGYMSALMAARHHQYFKCAIIMNPVVNNPFMMSITDIPEWVVAEVLGKNMDWNLSPADYAKLYETSPMSQPNKIPTLLFLGAKDRRVPYQQGLFYHSHTIANNGNIKTYIYPESNHSLDDSITTNFDILLKMFSFLENNL